MLSHFVLIIVPRANPAHWHEVEGILIPCRVFLVNLHLKRVLCIILNIKCPCCVPLLLGTNNMIMYFIDRIIAVQFIVNRLVRTGHY